MAGDFGFGGGRERWSASYDEDAVGISGDLDFLDILQDEESDLGNGWKNWHRDDPSLECEDENPKDYQEDEEERWWGGGRRG